MLMVIGWQRGLIAMAFAALDLIRLRVCCVEVLPRLEGD
jgi:hypothetical protein